MNTKTLTKAITTYGVLSQLDQTIEECAELVQAINKAKRAGIVTAFGIKPPNQESQMSEVEAYNNLCMEIADVKIMLAQMELMLDKDRIDLSIVRKLNRLEGRLNGGK